ncbi:MAG: AraC family transcriptional regulator [Lachnospiraceae bacterium]|nr:AraC family transcriptional regulator [Lachnospiraceae bacterium]
MYKILVADDEPIERMVVIKKIRKYFEGQLEVVSAVNGREAIEKFNSEGCQIALLDINMPGINGLEAAKCIRKDHKDSVIIFLTAYDDFNYARTAITVKALDYLLKPADDKDLNGCIYEAIHQIDTYLSRQGESSLEEPFEEESKLLVEEENTNTFCAIVTEYIQNHYAQELSLQDVAGILGYSEAYFSRVFKQHFQQTFIVYLQEYRVEKAKELLLDVSVNIKDVSNSVGYPDSNYFAKIFKKSVGMTPKEYRQKTLHTMLQS